MKNLLAALVLGLAACASAPQTPAPPAPAKLSDAVIWTMTAAEHDALTLQVFRNAAKQISELARDAQPGTWAVILDSDETVLDNAYYEQWRIEQGLAYSDSTWATFVYTETSTALPGAVDFLRHVHQLGGKVVIVTNRAETLCNATRSNLTKVGLQADLVMCKQTTSDKNPRFEAVQHGTTTAGWPPLRVLMWLGDNIQDFPRLTQANAEASFEHFGRDYFVLPNPMYGSWQ